MSHTAWAGNRGKPLHYKSLHYKSKIFPFHFPHFFSNFSICTPPPNWRCGNTLQLNMVNVSEPSKAPIPMDELFQWTIPLVEPSPAPPPRAAPGPLHGLRRRRQPPLPRPHGVRPPRPRPGVWAMEWGVGGWIDTVDRVGAFAAQQPEEAGLWSFI